MHDPNQESQVSVAEFLLEKRRVVEQSTAVFSSMENTILGLYKDSAEKSKRIAELEGEIKKLTEKAA
jgi:hypothetical protein